MLVSLFVCLFPMWLFSISQFLIRNIGWPYSLNFLLCVQQIHQILCIVKWFTTIRPVFFLHKTRNNNTTYGEAEPWYLPNLWLTMMQSQALKSIIYRSYLIFCHNSCGQFYDIMVSGKWCRLSESSKNSYWHSNIHIGPKYLMQFYLFCNLFIEVWQMNLVFIFKW